MKKAPLLFLLFLLCTTAAFSQTGSIRGKLVGGGSPLIGSTIAVLNPQDSAVMRGVAADVEGNFEVTGLRSGAYILKFSYLGFNDLFRRVQVANAPLELGTVTLNSSSTSLREVEVTVKAPISSQKGDTTELNATAFKTSRDATADNLIQKMPGITVVNGQVQAQGQQVQRVLVDGKEFFGDDPNAVLKNLPAEVISKIQVFDRQSDQAQFTGFNDGNEQKTINIITKPNMRNGMFGKLTAGAGTDSRYRISGSFNQFKGDRRITILAQTNNINEQNFSTEDLLGVASGGGNRRGGGGGGPRGGGGGGGPRGGGGGGGNTGDFLVSTGGGINKTKAVGLNYVDTWGKKVDVNGSYFFNKTDNVTGSFTNRIYTGDDVNGLRYTENNISESSNINHRLNMRITYKIDSANSIILRPRLSIQQNDGSNITSALTRNNNTQLDSLESIFNSNLKALNFANNLLFRHSFAKRGRTFSVDVNTEFTQNDGDSRLFSFQRSYNEQTNTTEDLNQNQISNLDGNTSTIGANVNYTEPLTKSTQLQLNYGASVNKGDSDQRTYGLEEGTDAQYTNLLTDQSSTVDSKTVTQNAGAGWRYQSKDFQIMLNARYQWIDFQNDQELPQIVNVQRNYQNFVPFAMIRYNLTRDKNMRFFYRTNTQIPSVTQLQSAIDRSNPLQLSTGNPFLQQTYAHNLSLNYSANNPEKSSSFFFLLSGAFTQDYIANSSYQPTTRTGNITVAGEELTPGMRLTRPVNLDGQFNLRSFMTYGLPLSFIKSNLNLNASVSYNHTPGMVNDIENFTNTKSYGLGAVISSNISENLDFTVSSNASINDASYENLENPSTHYYNQSSNVRLNWIVWKGLTFTSDLNHQYNQGLSAGFNQNFMLWNASIGYKFLKDRQAEIRLTGFDLLKQNVSVQRTIETAYTQDTQTNVLQRYFMLSFNYNLRKFGM